MALIKQNRRKVVVEGIISGNGWSNLDGEGVRLNFTVGSWAEPKRCNVKLSREEAAELVATLSKLLTETERLA